MKLNIKWIVLINEWRAAHSQLNIGYDLIVEFYENRKFQNEQILGSIDKLNNSKAKKN